MEINVGKISGKNIYVSEIAGNYLYYSPGHPVDVNKAIPLKTI